MSSGFADRGLTTWLPRRILLPEPIRWLSTVSFLSLVASCCQLSELSERQPMSGRQLRIIPYNGNRAYKYYLDGYKVNGKAKAALFQGPRRRPSETRGAYQAAKKRGARRARYSSRPQSIGGESGPAPGAIQTRVCWTPPSSTRATSSAKAARSTCLKRLRIT